MVDLVKWSLFLSYYTGRFTGVLNFEIDFKTGRVRNTKRATISAAVDNLVMLYLYSQILDRQLVAKVWIKTNTLQDTLFRFMMDVRMVCVFLSLASRWCLRRRFMWLFKSVCQLYLRHPDLVQYCRRSIVSKCFGATMFGVLQMTMILFVASNQLTVRLALRIFSIISITYTINVIITQYFIAMAIIRARYGTLAKELQTILAESASLVPNEGETFVTKCCQLANELEKIARAQSHLQTITERISTTYTVQIICLISTNYLNMVGNVYLMFSLSKYKALTASLPKLAILNTIAFVVFYYLDSWLNVFNVFYLIDSHNRMVKLLNQWTLVGPGMHPRLETAVSS